MMALSCVRVMAHGGEKQSSTRPAFAARVLSQRQRPVSFIFPVGMARLRITARQTRFAPSLHRAGGSASLPSEIGVTFWPRAASRRRRIRATRLSSTAASDHA